MEQDAKPRCRRGVGRLRPRPAARPPQEIEVRANWHRLAEGRFRFALYLTHPWQLELECAKRCFQAQRRSFELAKRMENRPRIAPCCNTEKLSHFAQFKALSTRQTDVAEFWRIPLQKNELRSSPHTPAGAADAIPRRWTQWSASRHISGSSRVRGESWSRQRPAPVDRQAGAGLPLAALSFR